MLGNTQFEKEQLQRIFEPVQLFARRFEVVLKEPNPLFVFDEGARLQLQDLLLELSNAQVAEIVIGVRAVLSFRIVRHVISRPFSPQSVFQKRISISRIFALLPLVARLALPSPAELRTIQWPNRAYKRTWSDPQSTDSLVLIHARVTAFCPTIKKEI